ncbi:MAG: type II toxin-antitoxin system VapC family toxin [Candidatus Micrarchaeaceae archaeon]|jgi:predicted nucleic acid-binding protein
MLLIDSSAVVKFFSKEPGWENVREHIAEALTIHLAIIELSSALSKKFLKGEIEENTALEILEEYSEKAILLDERSYINSAFKLSTSKNITIYDSFFIAAALQEGCALVSCDEKQIKVAKALGIKVVNC